MILTNLRKYIVKKQLNLTKLNNQKIGIYRVDTPKTYLHDANLTNIAVRISNYIYEKSYLRGIMQDYTIYLYIPDKVSIDYIKTKCIIIGLELQKL